MSDTQTMPEHAPEAPLMAVAVVPEVEPEPKPAPPAKEGKAEKVERKPEARPPAPAISADIRKIEIAEDAALRTLLEALGTQGSYFVNVTRIEPEEIVDPVTRQRVRVSGSLKKYTNEIVDEEFIAKRHGGGRYLLKIHRSTGKGEQYVPFRQRTIEVAGDPKLDDPCLNRIQAPAASSSAPASPPPPAEDGKVAVAAMAMAERAMMAQANHKPEKDPTAEVMVQMLRDELAAARTEMREMRASYEARLAQVAATPANPVESKLVAKLLDDDNARMSALRTQHESEVRMLKEQHAADIRRLEDRHDRALESERRSHERELAAQKSHADVLKIVQDSAGATTKEVLQGQIKALERQLEAKEREIERLQALKVKTPSETIKEMKDLKDLLSDDEDDEDESVIGQITNKLPDVIGAVGNFMGKGPQPQQPPAPQIPQPQRPQIVRGPNGEPYRQVGNRLVPVRPKPQMIQGAEGTPPVAMPPIPPERLEMIKNLLEQAYSNGTDPGAAAQTAKAALAGQEEIFTAIRQMGGVDEFLRKVANLRSDSPLLTQAGKNWVRKFSKSLVGE